VPTKQLLYFITLRDNGSISENHALATHRIGRKSGESPDGGEIVPDDHGVSRSAQYCWNK
jgi:hypothetical protein